MMPTTADTARLFLHTLFEKLFDPNVSSTEVGHYFHPEYQQLVDGKCLNFSEFMDHVAVLKKTLKRGKVTFEHVLVQGDHWADIHYVDAIKQDDSHVRVKVLAFYTFKDGKINRVEELTHLESGDQHDHDLGSRV